MPLVTVVEAPAENTRSLVPSAPLFGDSSSVAFGSRVIPLVKVTVVVAAPEPAFTDSGTVAPTSNEPNATEPAVLPLLLMVSARCTSLSAPLKLVDCPLVS